MADAQTETQVKQLYGIYAFARKDFVHPPLVGLSRCLKAQKYDTAILIEYE